MRGGSSKMKGKKREGTPDKAATPNASQELLSDPSKSSIIADEELEKIKIREDDLKQIRENLKLSDIEEDRLKDVIVRKLKPESEHNKPKLKNVKVLKQAPSESRVRPMEFVGGIRLDADNKVIPHSVLGDVNEFLAEAVRRGQIEHLPLPASRESADALTVKYEKKLKKPVDPMLAEDNALKNWQKKMMERKRQQGYISDMVKMPPEALVMNRGDKIREIVEERHLIDRAIPYVDYGKGFRVGSEFWKQQEQFGDDIKGIHMSLTHTEKGYPPPIEHIGESDMMQAEKNIRPASASSNHHPWNTSRCWNKSGYLQDRKRQLYPIMKELDPYKPDFSNLEVVGHKCHTDDVNRLDLSQVTIPTIDEESLDNLSTEHVQLNDQAPTSGPSIIFDGTSVSWTGDSSSNLGDVEAEARVTFECYATQRVMSTLEIINNGTTVIQYEWRSLPLTNPFDIVNAKVQRFYFNTSSGVVLPGDSMRVPFIFKSPNAGIFSERWQFETKPVLAGGAALIVTLRGVALQEDHYAEERNEIETDLRYRQAKQIVTQIIDTLIDGIRTPERPRSPVDAYITEEKLFEKYNNLVYHHHISDNIKKIYLELYPEEERSWREWDLHVDTINEIVMENNNELTEEGIQKLSDEDSEALLQKLNNAVNLASFPHFTPVQYKMYTVGMELLANTIDSMVDQSHQLRHVMGLPEKEQMEFPEDIADPRKKVDPKKAAKPDPKAAKAPDKKAKDAKGGPKAAKSTSNTKLTSRTDITTPGLTGVDSSTSLTDSKTVVEENPLEFSYKTKLYSLTYALLSESVLHMSDLFEDINSSS